MNPDVRRIQTDLIRFRAKGPFGKNFNGIFVDSAGWRATCYCPHCRKGFDEWVRARYAPGQIAALLKTDPAQPVPMTPPPGAAPDLVRVYDVLTRRFWTEATAEFFGLLEDAGEEVLGKVEFHVLFHGFCYSWRGAFIPGGMNLAWYSDHITAYCSEGNPLPGAAYRRTYAAPATQRLTTNLFEYVYSAGAFFREPVMVKSYSGPVARNADIVQLAVAQSVALLGNYGIYATEPPEMRNPTYVRYDWALPMVEFVHTIVPRVRQMIPAATTGVLFCAVDGMAGSDEHNRMADAVCSMLQRQHVPFQMVHMRLLERTLNERPLDALIVPGVRCVDDAQAARIRRFVEEGGRVLFMGECGGLTWEGAARERSAFADLLPPSAPPADGLPPTRVVGRGRTGWIGASFDPEAPEANRALQQALFALEGATPSRVRPDRAPALLLSLTRNSDRSRVWMHLVNYDVDMDVVEAPGVRGANPVKDVRVVIDLSAGLRAKEARLLRPGAEEAALEVVHGREGCAVTVPHVEVYALVEVVTEKGERPAASLLEPTTIAEAGDMVVAALAGRPSGKTLVPVAGAPTAEAPAALRRFSRESLVYAAASQDNVLRLRIEPEERVQVLYTVMGLDGRPLGSGRAAQAANLEIPVPAPGVYAVFMTPDPGFGRFRLRFEGIAALEASEAGPLAIYEPGDSAPLFFYVPKGRTGFTVACNTRHDRARLHAVQLTVKDAEGRVALQQDGPFDGWKTFEVAVPEGQAGRIWSLTFADAPRPEGAQAKMFAQFRLVGVPPVVAETPDRLLIARGDE